ncbi:major facilitator superfamily domain-containing protein [Aspergillus terricola var. indicus]
MRSNGSAIRLQQIGATIQLSTITLTATITEDLQLPTSLSLWPSSVGSLATASTLLLAGSVADTVGPRWVELVGSFASGGLMVGQGLARNGQVFVALRALQGVGLALHLASSVSVLGQLLPQGRGRNRAFSCLGLSLPLGFSLGLIVGGVMIDTVGWRLGWFISGGTTLVVSILGLWALPKTTSLPGQEDRRHFHRLRTRIDWVGAGILSANPSHIKSAECIAILCLAVLALPAFIAWSHHQVKVGNPALIPNALWKNRSFSSVCATVALSNGVLNAMELFASLFFQEVQGLSALQASIRILPSLAVGVLINVMVGQFVHRVPAFWIVTTASAVCAGSPLLMALVHPSTPYWANAFVTQVLQPISFGALYTVGLIVITDSFAKDTQALAGAVFNTASQFGNAFGLAEQGETGIDEWISCQFLDNVGSMVLCAVIGFWGLLGTGKVGLKQD